MLVGVFSTLIVESFIILILQCNSHLIFLQAMYLRTALIEEYFSIILPVCQKATFARFHIASHPAKVSASSMLCTLKMVENQGVKRV